MPENSDVIKQSPILDWHFPCGPIRKGIDNQIILNQLPSRIVLRAHKHIKCQIVNMLIEQCIFKTVTFSFTQVRHVCMIIPSAGG